MATAIKITSFGLGEKAQETSKEKLGGKGAGLVYMSNLGLPVPPGFILPTSLCSRYFADPVGTMSEIETAIAPYLKRLEAAFGYMPLLSVRSGARQSMPGMMDTILNVGLDDNTAESWVARLGSDCVADSARRLIEMYGSVVLGIDRQKFHGLTAKQARTLYSEETGAEFPDAHTQLMCSIEAVFKSWNNERAKVYRKLHSIPDSWGTAVTVMAMVFGNLNDKSGTGVLFTRNPDSGEKKVTGEFLANAQGEDVVAGTATPLPLSKMADWNMAASLELSTIVQKLEQDKKDVQDVEFTVQDGKLFVLQTRTAKRSARAAVRIAVEMLEEGLIDQNQMLTRVTFREYLLAAAPVIDPAFKVAEVAKGLPACSGVVTGVVVHDAKAAVASKKPCILVTKETTPDDIAGMNAAVGVLTMTGGATSHAAVVARAMNRPCVVGLGKEQGQFAIGSTVSLDGATGRVWKEVVPVVSGNDSHYLKKFTGLVKELVPPKTVVYEGQGYLDVARLGPEDALEEVQTALASTEGRVVVNLVSCASEAEAVFGKMFGLDRESETLALLSDLSLSDKARLVLLTTRPLPASVQSIARVKSLQELVEATGEVLLDFVPAQWEQKLVQWKMEKEPVAAVSVGALVPGVTSYVNELEVVAEVLSAAQKGV